MYLLFKLIIFIGNPYWRQVDNSWIHIWILASPVTQHTKESGLAIWTPIADGRPNPMAPKPPELIHLLGYLYLYSWAAHIWCCPTSEVINASPLVTSYNLSTTNCGLIILSSCLYENEFFFLHVSISFHHNSMFGCSSLFSLILFIKRLNTFFTSPITERSTRIFLEIEDGSISIWIFLEFGLNISNLPVILSSNLAPIAIIKSQSCIAIFASYEPCIPNIWINCLSFPG